MIEMINSLPTQEYLKECFEYDAEKGVLIWKHRPENHFRCRRTSRYWNGRYPGIVAGAICKNGNINVFIDGVAYIRSRIVWKFVTGADPNRYIDHINRTRTDDRFSNLRECEKSQNCSNVHKRKDNTSGYKGVSFHRSRNTWVCRIQVNRKRKCIGYFKTPQEAHEAYKNAAKLYHGDFAYLGE